MKRRTILTAAVPLGSAAVIGGPSLTYAAESFVPFDADTKIELDGDRTAIIERAGTLGNEYETTHHGCARCTVAALQDALPFLPADESVYRTACCLNGGATPTKLANCGAFTGAGIIIGWVAGTPRFEDVSLSHELIRKVHDRFAEEYGSVLCASIRTSVNAECGSVVGKACRWTAEIILDRFT